MTNRVGVDFLFEYMDLRDAGLSHPDIEAAALNPIRENWEQTLEEDRTNLTATLEGRVQAQAAEGDALLDEAALIDITAAARTAIQAHQEVCQKLEKKGEKLKSLLQQAEGEQQAMHARKQLLNASLQKLRSELYNGSPDPRWIDLHKLRARSKEIGDDAARRK